MIREVLAVSVTSVAVACRTVDAPYPDLGSAETKEIVVVGYFSSGAYLPEDPVCGTVQPDGTEIICLDPPPMRLRFNLAETLYGSSPPSSFYAFTTSHYGLDQVDIGKKYPYLVHFETDGQSYLIPRYHLRDLARDNEDQLALPAWPGSFLPTWLPCDLTEAEQPFAFTGPESRIRIKLEECDGDSLCDPTPRTEIKRGYAYVRSGIPLRAVRDSLARASGKKLHFLCEGE